MNSSEEVSEVVEIFDSDASDDSNYDDVSSSLDDGELSFKDIKFEFPLRMMICGASGSGKTNIILLFIEKYFRLFQSTVIFGSMVHKLQRSPLIERQVNNNVMHLFSDLNIELIDNIIRKQKERQAAGKSLHRMLLIFDDITKFEMDHPVMNSLWTEGRHLHLNVISSVQYYTMIDTIQRTNSSYYILTEPSINNVRVLANYSNTPARTLSNLIGSMRKHDALLLGDGQPKIFKVPLSDQLIELDNNYVEVLDESGIPYEEYSDENIFAFDEEEDFESE
jgi:hypothetical protein